MRLSSSFTQTRAELAISSLANGDPDRQVPSGSTFDRKEFTDAREVGEGGEEGSGAADKKNELWVSCFRPFASNFGGVGERRGAGNNLRPQNGRRGGYKWRREGSNSKPFHAAHFPGEGRQEGKGKTSKMKLKFMVRLPSATPKSPSIEIIYDVKFLLPAAFPPRSRRLL